MTEDRSADPAAGSHETPERPAAETAGSTGFDRVAEVSAIWDADETVVGSIWRDLREGKTVQQIAEEWGGATTPSTISRFVNIQDALLHGTIPTAPSVASEIAGRVRKWLRTKPLSPQLCQALEAQEQQLTARVNDAQASAAEAQEAVLRSKEAESRNIAGIYVYTLPHYIKHPYDPKTGRTLLKVGHSSVDALFRASSQARVTSLPEDPWLLRIYPAEASSRVEKEFHGFLRDADHDGVRGTRTGAEWFLTSLKFLDRVARSLGLEVQIINDPPIDDDE